jgi:hypothetical protein
MKHVFTSLGRLVISSLFTFFGLGATLQAQVLFDNGPYFNSVGTGAGGANESVLYTTTFGMGTIGFGHQQNLFNRVADDFTITSCNGFQIDSVVFFAYQTNSPATSTMTGVNLRIWDSIPDASGSAVVFGDTTTNRLTRTAFSGAYRITETTPGATSRPIMRNVCSLGGVILPAGTYWLDWSSAGSLASGPWAPPRTPVGVAITGNGRQRTGSTWNNLVDGGTGTPPQGLPFIIYGKFRDPIADAGIDPVVCQGTSTPLGGAPSGASGIGSLSYSWSPSTGLNDSTLANPSLTATASGTYVLSVIDSLGCVATDTVSVSVLTPATDFLPGDTTVCVGGTLQVSAIAGLSYFWSTGATTQSVTAGPGTISVTLTDSLGCVTADTLTISEAAEVEITGAKELCPGETVTLAATLASGSYVWSTGDTSSTVAAMGGATYSVSVTDPFGCVSADTVTLGSLPGAVASFVFTQSNFTYTFADSSAGGITAWFWDFGDGNTSTSPNPVHTYATAGNYPVSLIVTNICGSDTLTKELRGVSIDGELGLATVVVQPVPAQGQFTFEVKGLSVPQLSVDLMDMQGKVVRHWDFSQANQGLLQSVDASSLPKGVYLLRFSTAMGQASRRVILE